MIVDDEMKEKNETARTMLQIYHERNTQLANMLIALNGFMLAFISGLITFVGSTFFSSPQCVTNCVSSACSCSASDSSGKVWGILLVINIAIIVMILWRFYAHYIDNDIVNCYRKIIWFEHELTIDEKVTLLNSLEVTIPNLKDKIQDLFFDEQFERISNLIQNKKFGERGQKIIDKIVCVISGSLIFFELFWSESRTIIISQVFPNWIIILIIVFEIAAFYFLFYNPRNFPIHENP